MDHTRGSQSTTWLIEQTTIMAVEFDGGVVLGADSRTSTGAFSRPTDREGASIPFFDRADLI